MKKFYALLVWCILSIAISFAQETPLTQLQIESFNQEVSKKNKEIKTIDTDFIQYKNISFMSKEIESKGKMLLSIPNKLLWKYSSPIAYSVLFSNQKISINDQGKKNAIDLGSNKKFAKINSLIVSSVSGQMFDKKEFSIRYFMDKKRRIAKMKPLSKDISQYISEIVLYFDEGQSTVSEVKLIEPSTDYTRIVFVNKKLNTKLDEKSFSN